MMRLNHAGALAVLVIVAVAPMQGLAQGLASGPSVRLARQCEAQAAKAAPTSFAGVGTATEDYFRRCIANNGKADTTPKPSVGEMVEFPSGGPVMTVVGVKGDDVTVRWTTDTGQVVSGTFQAAALVRRTTVPTQNPGKEYAEPGPYRPCPASVSFKGRNACLG